MSKEIRPGRLFKTSRKKKIVIWACCLSLGGGGIYAGYRYTGTTEVEVAVARVRRGDFIISVTTRGELKSAHSTIITTPRVPNPRIVRLAESGKMVHKGDVIVEFDSAQQEQNVIERTTGVRTADSQIVQTKASQKITNEADAMNLMSGEYDLERSKLEASKAEILSAIDGAKNRIQVGVSEGALNQVKTTINSRKVSQQADLDRLVQSKDKTVRDLGLAKDYLSQMVLYAPKDGVVNILPNFRSGGSFGQSTPPFKEGDNAWTGAAIAEIPDLSEMYVDMKLDEVDRGKLRLGQAVRVRVDAVPEKEFLATLDWISPIAALNFVRGGTAEKTFPARATLKSVEPQMRPGMSASAEVIIERDPSALLIPLAASFTQNDKPAVYVQRGHQFLVRTIQVGKRNEDSIVVLGGLREGEIVTLENPAEAAKRAKKKL